MAYSVILASLAVALATHGAATGIITRAPQAAPQAPVRGLGQPPSEDRLAKVAVDVLPDGRGLPPGSGSAAGGRRVYDAQCASCHGRSGREGPNDLLAGGQQSLVSSRPIKTVGSYWPYATTLWDYINRAMPYARPHTLTVDEVYAVTAYVLYLNELVEEQQAISNATLPQIEMPNRNGFIPDTRPHENLPR